MINDNLGNRITNLDTKVDNNNTTVTNAINIIRRTPAKMIGSLFFSSFSSISPTYL